MTIALTRAARRLCLTLPLLFAIAACKTSPPQQTTIAGDLPFEQAAAEATDALVAQAQTLPAFLAKLESRIARRAVVVDPMLDATSGQQTAATVALERRVRERIAQRHESLDTLAFESANLAKANYLITGTMTRLPRERGAAFRIDLALVDLKAGTVAARATANARDTGVDTTPTAYYRDSPVVVKDGVIEGYIRTTSAQAGQPADRLYLERIEAATLIREATALYDEQRYPEALERYGRVAETPAGKQIRALNGVYLTNWKLGRMADAEQAFAKVVALGIDYRQLGVKFLFNPGGTEFWSDSRISGAYGMWLRQIARTAAARGACMNIVGHTSRTGSDAFNQTLSLQRAEFIRQRLAAEAGEISGRAKPVGMGFRENIVGSGTDDAVDALDRRVEFKIVPCGG